MPGEAEACAQPFLAAGGEMGALMRGHAWRDTAFGPGETWPQPLVTLVRVMLSSRQPMFIAWGRERALLYNDAYAPLLGARHPHALGRPFFDVWPETRREVGPLMDQVFAGCPVHMDDLHLTLHRNGGPEEAHFAFSYTPVPGDDGTVAGLFCACTETTRQVLAEREVLQAAERQRRTLQELPGFMAMLKEPGHIFEYVNDAYVAISGPRRFIGRGVREVFPELEGQGFYELLDRVAATGEPYSARAVAVRLAGEAADRFIDLRYQPIQDGAGRVTGILIAGYDVSEAIRTAGALRDLNADVESEVAARAQERSRTWLVSTDLLGVLNPQGIFVRTNPAWQAVLGWSEAEIASAPFINLLHPDDIERNQAAFQHLKEGNPVLSLENRYRTKAGSYRWLSWVAVPEGGLYYCSARDITAEKEQAAALTERTAERDRLWRISQDPFLVSDMEGRWLRASPAWTEILGWSEAELVGRTSEWMEHPDDWSETRAEITGLAAGRATRRFENRFRGRDGAYRWFSWTAVPEGGLLYCVARDVTAEKEQAQARERLEEQLRQSQKMEAVGQLTGGLAHDFNNLLTGVTGSLELLQTRIAQGRIGDVDRYANAAQGAAKRAAALTHRLLAFSRRQTLDPKPTNVNRLVAGMEELIRRTVGPGIAMEPLVAAGGLWTTLVDPGQLENALLNLCINARDAMPDGGKLTVETGNRWLDERAARERDLAPGQYVSLCVSDTGTGMTPEVAAKAFDPFFTTKPIGQGTGLGLSMIYGFARQSGGQARIYSEPGQGTMVCLYLPRHLGEEDSADAPPELADAPRAEQGETVLVVDDEPTVRMLVTEVLADLGYTAIEAADGAAGLRVLQSDTRIDLLVTDVGLPGGMNGRQVADAARVARPGLKVLFITGYAENAVLSHGHLDPGMHVLTKPFAMEALASRIRTLITESQA